MENINFLVLFALIWTSISFFLYWPMFVSLLKAGLPERIIPARYYGFVLFGVIPVMVLMVYKADLVDVLGLKMPSGDLLWHFISLAIVFAVVPVSFFQSRSQANLKDFPQIRNHNWSKGLYVSNLISWMVYLLAYEILFRGLLWFPLIDEFGFYIALSINVSFYSFTHMAKNFREALGTIPIGIILALIAWKTNSIAYPIIIHWVMALSNSIFSIRHHPDIKVMFKR